MLKGNNPNIYESDNENNISEFVLHSLHGHVEV